MAPTRSSVDPSGAPYIQEIVGGTLTIAAAGKQSIIDVLPGGGLLPDRSVLKIKGMGFTSNTRIAIEGTNIFFPGDTKFVDSTEIDVKLLQWHGACHSCDVPEYRCDFPIGW